MAVLMFRRVKCELAGPYVRGRWSARAHCRAMEAYATLLLRFQMAIEKLHDHGIEFAIGSPAVPCTFDGV